MKKYKVALCRFPGSGWEVAGLGTWLMETYHKMKLDDRIEGVISIIKSDTPITMTRNAAVKDALAVGCDYILMADSDIIPDYLVGTDGLARPFWDTAWEFMMVCNEIQRPPATIAAPYCGPPPDECPFVFRWKDRESNCPDPSPRLEMLEREDAAWRSGIEEVAALATGLILYDARVFMPEYNLPMPWFDYEYSDPERSIKGSTEDVYQTRNASLLGMPQYVAWDCWCAHVKQKWVMKPRPLTVDVMSQELAKAMGRGRRSDERLRFVTR